MRRILIIAAVLILLIVGGAAAYFYFFYDQSTVAVGTPSGDTTLPTASDNPGQNVGINDDTGQTTTSTTTPNQPQKVSNRLIEIDAGPAAAGVIAFDTGNASTSDVLIRYIHRDSGNVYEYQVGKNSLTRISNKTIPGITEALWTPSGTTAYLRYLSGEDRSLINTYALPVSSSGTNANGYFLAQKIQSLAVSSTTLLALSGGVGGTIGTTMRPDGSQSHQAFASPLTALRVSIASKNQLFAFTKSSSLYQGYLYQIDSTGIFSKIAGPFLGLSALVSPNGKYALISYSSGGLLKSALLTIGSNIMIPLPLGTIADKCAWTPKEDALYCGVPETVPSTYAYPDDWYQGVVHFSDKIWRFNVGSRYAELILDFSKEANQPLDATSLSIDAAQKTLVFRNKNDASIWAYSL